VAGEIVGVVSSSAACWVMADELVHRGLSARPLTGLAEAHSVKVLLILARDAEEACQMVADAGILGGSRPVIAVVLDEGDSDARGRVLEAGADDCLSRPVSVRELSVRLGRLIGMQNLAGETARYSAVFARDLARARRIQEHILPLEPPNIAGLDIVAHYLPAAELGGDFFDIVPLEDGKVGFFMADVAGHGVGAALTTMLIKSQLVIWARPGIMVAETLGLLNNYLFPLVDIDFATAVYVVYDRRRQSLEYAMAGHPNPVLIRPQEGARSLEAREPPGRPQKSHIDLPLGLFDDSVYLSNQVMLQPGDKVLLYTDGLTEWRDDAGQALGVPALCSLLAESGRQPLREQIAALIGYLQTRSGGRPLDDDVNLLAFMPG
jgi:sigma-B regulation protein RsbU (phosphoserine phosphatase)